MSQVFLAMELLGKEDQELDLDHSSKELLPFFQTLYTGDYATLTDDNVLDTLKLAHKYDTTQLDAACKIYLLAACPKLEAVGTPKQDELSLLSVTVQLQNHSHLQDVHEQYVDAMFRQLRWRKNKIGDGACANCKANPGHNPNPSTHPKCPWASPTCDRSSTDPFVHQKALVRRLNLSTTLRIIHNLDSDLAKSLQA